MTCSACGEKPVESSKDFTKAVIEINNPESLVLLRKVVIPASMGTEEDVPPAIGKYRNVLLQYAANDHIYLYSSDGIPTSITANIPQEILDQIAELEANDVELQQEIDDLKNSPDVVDIVPTYAALQAYDTSKLGDNDIIRVLADETHDGQSTYYRWNATASSWTYIGAVGDYYTKTQVDNLIATAPAFKPFPTGVVTNGTTEQFMNSILALNPEVGTAYLGTVSLSDMPTGLLQEEVEVYVYSDYVVYCVMRSTDVAPYSWWCASYNYQGWKPSDTTYTAGTNVTITGNVISATDTTYSNFVGTDGTAAGTAGLVPAPATTDAGKFLKADGTWDTAGGGGPTVVQTTGSSTTDVMSQKAVTDELYPQYATKTNNVIGIGNYNSIADYGSTKIGIGRVTLGNNSAYAVAIHGGDSGGTVNAISALGIWAGNGGTVTGHSGVAIGSGASVSAAGGVAIGRDSSATSQGEFNIGSSSTSYGYNNTNYRLLSGVHDGQNAHDAATVGQLNGRVLQNAGAPTTATVGTVGQLLEDTTNGKLYICTAVTPGTAPDPDTYTWTEVGAGGSSVTVVQTTGTSQTDVMSQNAVTSMVFADPASKRKIQIGHNSVASGTDCVAIGMGAQATNAMNATAIGEDAFVSHRGSVALGSSAQTTVKGQIMVGTANTYDGYNSTNYRIVSGVHDAQSDNDAVNLSQLNGRVATNAGAPTTSTAGTVGQLLEDTTNGKLYICTAVDTTDPQNPSYTWTEVGAGGSSVTVVQTTGTSQTDVMSQNATTSMIFGDPGTNNKIVIGTGASVSAQNYNMAIGTSADGNGVQSTAVGYSAKARPNGTALGYNAQAGTTSSQTNATAIGQSAYGGGDHCTAVGDNSNATNSYSTAIGANARAKSERSLAIGVGASVENSPAMAYSVALGANSVTSRAGEVNVGTGSNNFGYNSTPYRVIGGVHDAVDNHDAVTLGQLNGRVTQNAGAPTTSTAGTVGQLLEDTTNGKLYICTAVDTTDPNTPVYTWTEVGAGGGGTTEIEYVNCTLTGATATGFTLSADKTATQVKALVESGKEVIYKFVNSVSAGSVLAGTYEFSVLYAGTNTSVDVVTGYGITVPYGATTPDIYTFLHTGSSVTVTASTIPTVNNATLTIQKNGTTVQTFTANASSNATANIEVPTITMTTTDPGEGSALAADNFVAVYGGDPVILDYSTSEINTGMTWIDGSTIYKKTVSTGALPNTTVKTVAHGILNLGLVIDIKGFAWDGSSTWLPIPNAGSSSAAIEAYVYSSNICITTGMDRSGFTTSYVTLYYTKSV